MTKTNGTEVHAVEEIQQRVTDGKPEPDKPDDTRGLFIHKDGTRALYFVTAQAVFVDGTEEPIAVVMDVNVRAMNGITAMLDANRVTYSIRPVRIARLSWRV